MSALDLRALALIFDAGRAEAERLGEHNLARVLEAMTESAVSLREGAAGNIAPNVMYGDLRAKYGYRY